MFKRCPPSVRAIPLDAAPRQRSRRQTCHLADIQAIAVRYQDTVALFAALGGGW
jgi:hypothetical protein